MKRTAILLATSILSLLMLNSRPAAAQELDNTFGGWEFFEINHGFRNSNWFATFYFEHDNYQYRRLECWYTRTTVGYKINKWLKADVCYDFLYEPAAITHKALFDLTGTLREGNLSVQIRERYTHSWTPDLGEQGDVLRSRLKVQYAIPETRFKPYLAMEVFTWGDTWKKTRHYVATTYDFDEHFQIEGYYLYYTFAGLPAEHVLGIGLNMDF
ncbi:MAG: DUF2490 domain-containing protein [Bacteroidales bacterium]|nr:DUF2490 domain-containing protein [Bacteroidales bacterium]